MRKSIFAQIRAIITQWILLFAFIVCPKGQFKTQFAIFMLVHIKKL